jgi:UDP:flavonoid glycosyltransferase YjiC (YdhE family)
VRVERFVAHGPVLERAAAVVTHSGMGIVQKAIAAGVPIAAVPFGRDQPEVARRVVEAGAGVQLRTKDLSPEELVEGDPAARRRARWGQPSRSRP